MPATHEAIRVPLPRKDAGASGETMGPRPLPGTASGIEKRTRSTKHSATMKFELNNLQPAVGSNKDRKRIGRGPGSGYGGTSTRGHKGAKSRSGYKHKVGFEGGQMPLQRRVPKFGFKNINRVEYKAINLNVLEELAQAKDLTKITVADLLSAGLVSKNSLVKILGGGKLTKALEVEANAFSKSAEEAIAAAGGSVIKK